MWYLWCGSNSPLSGRVVKTFERTFLSDESTWKEPKNPYYRYQDSEPVCRMLLREFGLYSENSHIINGHTPIHVMEGENPLKANGRLIVIDGGFCKAYQKTTGIAGYTLIFNSHGMRLKSHQPFSGMEAALSENLDTGQTPDGSGYRYRRDAQGADCRLRRSADCLSGRPDCGKSIIGVKQNHRPKSGRWFLCCLLPVFAPKANKSFWSSFLQKARGGTGATPL